ncbi:FAD-binding domain-containing protein [Aspergillus nidulans var. acristatus]
MRLFVLFPVATCTAALAFTNAQLPNRVSYPSDPEYALSQTSYYTIFERDLHPSCIFRPQTTTDVSRFIKLATSNSTVTTANARQGSSKFAIRSRGHTLFSGAANINAGVIIDLRSLSSLSISADRKTASVGGGALFSDLYPELETQNLTVMGGRVPGIGVGGFTTGGGLSYLSRERGFAGDNVYGYEVVLGNGSIVYASADENRDLWLALKGGSSNFGIVTRFDLAAFEQGLMWGGIVGFNYTRDAVQAHADAFSEFMKEENFDKKAMMAMILSFTDHGGFGIADSVFYTQPIPRPVVYQPFLQAGEKLFDSTGLNTVGAMVDKLGDLLPASSNRTTQLVYSFKNSPARSLHYPVGIKHPGLNIQYLIQPQAVTNAANVLGLDANKTDMVLATLTVLYDDVSDDRVVLGTLNNIVTAQTELLKQAGLYSEFKYLNYADIAQDVFGSYGGDNIELLKAVSRRYDSGRVFQRNVPGGFKVFA